MANIVSNQIFSFLFFMPLAAYKYVFSIHEHISIHNTTYEYLLNICLVIIHSSRNIYIYLYLYYVYMLMLHISFAQPLADLRLRRHLRQVERLKRAGSTNQAHRASPNYSSFSALELASNLIATASNLRAMA